MKSRYSILLGLGFVIGLFFMVNLVIWDNLWVTTDLFLVILLAGGYITTYSSNIGKSRVALISGIGVSIILIIYQLFINKTSSTSEVSLISFLIIPGFFMLIGGFVAKNTKVKMTNLLNSLSQSKSKFG
jgi:hypothetical protein